MGTLNSCKVRTLLFLLWSPMFSSRTVTLYLSCLLMPQPDLSSYSDSLMLWQQADHKGLWLRATLCRWPWCSDVGAVGYFDSFELYSMYKYFLLTHLIRILLEGRVCVSPVSFPLTHSTCPINGCYINKYTSCSWIFLASTRHWELMRSLFIENTTHQWQ